MRFLENHKLKSILCASCNAYCNSTIITTPILFTSICTRCLEHSSLQNYWISVSPWIFNRDLLMKPFIIIYERMIPVSSCSSVCVCVSFLIYTTPTHTHTHLKHTSQNNNNNNNSNNSNNNNSNSNNNNHNNNNSNSNSNNNNNKRTNFEPQIWSDDQIWTCWCVPPSFLLLPFRCVGADSPGVKGPFKVPRWGRQLVGMFRSEHPWWRACCLGTWP